MSAPNFARLFIRLMSKSHEFHAIFTNTMTHAEMTAEANLL